jgi:hypothetical protein
MAKPRSRVRNKFLHVAVTEEEHRVAERVARTRGVSVSDLVRMLLLREREREKDGSAAA